METEENVHIIEMAAACFEADGLTAVGYGRML
jgi:hypothetical protein